jgi:hypothetical protein
MIPFLDGQIPVSVLLIETQDSFQLAGQAKRKLMI